VPNVPRFLFFKKIAARAAIFLLPKISNESGEWSVRVESHLLNCSRSSLPTRSGTKCSLKSRNCSEMDLRLNATDDAEATKARRSITQRTRDLRSALLRVRLQVCSASFPLRPNRVDASKPARLGRSRLQRRYRAKTNSKTVLSRAALSAAPCHPLRTRFLPARRPPVLFPLRGPGEEQNRPVTAEQEKINVRQHKPKP
jgi:hypothetical protein